MDIRIFLNVCSQLGLIIFMFVVGLEVDVPGLARSSKPALLIGGTSVVLPFCIGSFVLGPSLYEKYKGRTCTSITTNGTAIASDCTDVSEIAFELFLGVALSVTAFPVLARIIADYRMIRLPIGVLVMGCAALNDVVAWLLLTICLAIKQASSGGYAQVITMVCALIGYFLAQCFVLNPILRLMVVRQFRQKGEIGPGTMAFVLINLLVSSWFLHYLGFHAMLGAFLFGIAFPRSDDSGLMHLILEKLETVSVLMLLPCFFLITGLSIDLSKLGASGGLDLLYVCIVAVFGKVLGAGVPAYLLGMGLQKTSTVAVLMNTRGLAEIVILNIGLQQNILSQQLFTIMVVMAVVTTVMAGPLLQVVYPIRLLEKHLLELDEAMLRRDSDDDEKAGDDSSILLAVVHDATQAYSIIAAGVDTLLAGQQKGTEDAKGRTLVKAGSREALAATAAARAVQLVVLHFEERRGEIGTGLQETTTEVEQRHVLERAVGRLEQEGRVVAGGLVVLRVRDAEGSNVTKETCNIARTLLPELAVVDWPADSDDQAALKHTILAANCPVLLYTGRSSDPFVPPPAVGEGSEDGEVSRTDVSLEVSMLPDSAPAALIRRWGPLSEKLARLAAVVEEEFGGFSWACCLGLGSEGRGAAGAVGEEAGRVVEAAGGAQRSLARERVEKLRKSVEGPLYEGSAGQAAEAAAEQAAGRGKGLVTVIISGLDRPASDAAPSRASAAEVEHIFRALGVAVGGSGAHRGRSAWPSPHMGPSARSSRAFAPILISPRTPVAADRSSELRPASAELRWMDADAPPTLPLPPPMSPLREKDDKGERGNETAAA